MSFIDGRSNLCAIRELDTNGSLGNGRESLGKGAIRSNRYTKSIFWRWVCA